MGGHHHHQHAAERGQRRLAAALVLSAGALVAEVIGGIVAGSLALLADAAHVLADVAALSLSLFAGWMSRRPATSRHTFGFHRTEILVALANAALLLAASAYVVVEAIPRLAAPSPVQGPLMLAVAAGGLAVNGVSYLLLRGVAASSLNLRSAMLHVVGDALGSVAALAAALLVWLGGWHWADPVASLVIIGLVLVSAWRLLRETVGVLMEGAPGHLDVDEVRDAIAGLPGVLAVHDLHVWTITSGMVSMSCHVVWPGVPPHDALERIHGVVHDGFGIEHVTVQLEPEGFEERRPCG